MQRLSARPHNVGSPYDKDNAEWLLAKFKQYGFDAHIEVFDVLFPTPKERLVELIAPTKFTSPSCRRSRCPSIRLRSRPLSSFPPTTRTRMMATSPARWCTSTMACARTTKQLDRLGVSVKGAIVIARYGGAWRGIKPKVAAEHGAMGCLIYSDPRDDGFFEGQYFPDGPYPPADGVQRGSVMDTEYPGDPLTPGVGATKDAKRLSTLRKPKLSPQFRCCPFPMAMRSRCLRPSPVRSCLRAGVVRCPSLITLARARRRCIW